MFDKLRENRLLKYVHDKNLIDYFYLDYPVDKLVDKLTSLTFTIDEKKTNVPFNAQVKDYKGATDSDGNHWIIKKILPNEVLPHKLQELAYYIDFMLETLAAPTVLDRIENEYYRVTKVVQNAVNISSYNYLQNPFRKVLSNDLINRWFFFDEDRNPNNYMVIHNSKNNPMIVAIDYNKADIESEEMKITGNENKFGWYRKEKTRYLTLLDPANFEGFSIANFDYRLKLLTNLPLDKIKEIAIKILTGFVDSPEKIAEKVISNLDKRRKYIDEYFRRWFKENEEERISEKEDQDYSGFGKSFLNYYKNKK